MAVAVDAGLSAGRVPAQIRYGPAIVWCCFVVILVAGAWSIGLIQFGAEPGTAAQPLARLLSGDSPFWDAVRQRLEQSGIAQANEEILGPFSEISARVTAALYTAVLPEARESSLHWALLSLTPLIAIELFVVRAGAA